MTFNEYIENGFKQSARDFLVRCGVWNPKAPIEQIVENFNTQMRQVKEECLELLTAYGTDDDVEKLDGVIDVHFTMVNFEFMFEEIYKIQRSNPALAVAFEEGANEELIDLLSAILQPTLELPRKVPDESLLKAAQLVAANNALKYTDSLEEAQSWEIDNSDGLDTKVVANEVDGKIWYCLKDNQGKVRKHKNFKKVKLEDLV